MVLFVLFGFRISVASFFFLRSMSMINSFRSGVLAKFVFLLLTFLSFKIKNGGFFVMPLFID